MTCSLELSEYNLLCATWASVTDSEFPWIYVLPFSPVSSCVFSFPPLMRTERDRSDTSLDQRLLLQVPYVPVSQTVYTYTADPLAVRSCCRGPCRCFCRRESVSAPRVRSAVDQPLSTHSTCQTLFTTVNCLCWFSASPRALGLI